LCYVSTAEDPGSRRIYDPELLIASERALVQIQKGSGNNSLDFRRSRMWMEMVYPRGLSEIELQQLAWARGRFESHVADLKPMVDPVVDDDLELTLFQSLQVVPSKYEARFLALKRGGRHLSAKRLLVNVDLRAWLGASYRAERSGLQSVRKRIYKDREFWIGLFEYTRSEGLRLDSPRDESGSNIC